MIGRPLVKLIGLLTPVERRQAVGVLLMVVVMALLDALGVASIMPFMAVVTNPDLVETNIFLATIYKGFGTPSIQDFLLTLGVLIFVILLLSLSFKALTTYFQLRFTLMREYSLGKRLVEGYLHQPYPWFLTRNSADLGKAVLSEVNTVIYNGMLPAATLIAQSAVAGALLLLLLIVNPSLALTMGVVLGCAYALIFKFMNRILNRLGQERVDLNSKRFTSVNEAFSAVKEVKVGRLEAAYIKRFAKPAELYAKYQAAAQVIVFLPRFALEAIAFGGLMLMALYLMLGGSSFAQALPIISLYAFAGYRLIPAMQQIYSSLSSLRFMGPAIDVLYADLSEFRSVTSDVESPSSMILERSIILSNVTYSYPGSARAALDGVNLTIPANKVIGLVGASGSGKTTAVDLLMGLLEAQNGSLCVDNVTINPTNVRQWQKLIGYVPQQIYLADDTVAANIAFGIAEDNIDLDKVTHAARIANLHDFVMTDLPNGYDTQVGERGVRLSGGQRQRIGIARALYHNPQVLILDEATSALDNLTEFAVMEAINQLRHNITIVLIAHRLSTVKDCDQIYLLEKGQVLAQGSYDELRQTSEVFQKMTKVFE